ncbi:MAG TPA: UvrD-helicase domain-containing protein [Gaiellaceae bacterium]|nr:UvrD-helicase domain-containing protein [Gaiellaceae bacterium]
MSHPELKAEQAYVDRAYAYLERMRETVLRAGDAADGEVAQAALDAWAAKRLATFEDAERGLLFGRLDFEAVARALYVGRRWVHDEEGDQVVVNWQAPAARPFYTATPQDPHGVTLRRRFRAQGRKLLDIADEALDGSSLDGASVADFLLEELERSRDTHMRDIVATIQADQYRLITREPDRPLVIQGGPGTGKTAVGLHRASWLIYTERERNARSRVLVVGPNRTFMEYVSHVLPALGEGSVEQLAVSELVPGVEPGPPEQPEVARLKADTRLAEVIARAAELRLAGEPEELILKLEGVYIRVRVREQRALLEEIRGRDGTTAAARERFRMGVVRSFYSEYGRVLQGAAFRDGEQVEQALKAGGTLNAVVDRAWPLVTPEKLVRSLFTTPGFLAEAAEGILDEAEQRLLRRRAAGWSAGDVPLLDEAHALVGEPARTYDHVIVDEAQDLSPMQLRMIARRARGGALTILGDVAQGTGPVAYGSWDDVLPYLPRGGEAEVEELRHAYRVPREIMELALPLLETIAPGTLQPLAYRVGGSAPVLRHVEEHELLREAYVEAARLAREDGLVALIVPDELVEPALAHESAFDSIPLLTPREAKGLEFDHVIVVEPALVAAREQGLRELYVALTRPTTTLVIVHARPLPAELGLP